jgi:glycosyltransferase involved in cell wall biosynthesis
MQSDAKLKIVVSGHLPPPMGGVGMYYQTLLGSTLPAKVDLKFVETSAPNRPSSTTGRWSFSNIFSAFSDCFRFARAVMDHKPEVTHIATAFGLSFAKHSICVLIARLMHSKVLLHPHCSFLTLYSNTSKLWQWYVRQIIHLTDGVIALSTEWHQLEKYVPSCRVYNLPNGINLAPYYGVGSDRIRSNENRLPLRILYLGHIGHMKGSFDLLSSAQKLIAQKDPVMFDLVGENLREGEIEQLKKQISDSGSGPFIKVDPPAVGNTKIDLFRSVDVFVYPSYHEGMPMAIIEAMACGLPVIGTKVGGIPDLVQPEVNGLLVDAGCPDQLAEAIHRLVIDPNLREAMQVNSFRIAQEKYDIEKLVDQLIGIYEMVASGKNGIQAIYQDSL